MAMMHRHDRWYESRCVRTESHKLVRNFSPSRQPAVPTSVRGGAKREERPVVELYDLEEDPHELQNRADDPSYHQTKAELSALLLSWMKQVNDPLLNGPMPTPYHEMAMRDLMA